MTRTWFTFVILWFFMLVPVCEAQERDDFNIETIASGLVHPWSIAFLPDGRAIVSELPGRISIVSRALPPVNAIDIVGVRGIPAVFADNGGGLMDLAVGDDELFMCFTRAAGDKGQRTAVARAVLRYGGLTDTQIIFEQTGSVRENAALIACRVAISPDGKLVVAFGAGCRLCDPHPDSAYGKVMQFNRDGGDPAILSRGHRNPEGLAFGPDGALWEQEHGPRGGDEINIIERGADYGWPAVGHGTNYDGSQLHRKVHSAKEPVWFWTPSIGPSGMTFYSGKLWPDWKGSLFNGALAAKMVSRLAISGHQVVGEERMLSSLGERIRDVREAPDGSLWLLTDSDNGRVLRITPK